MFESLGSATAPRGSSNDPARGEHQPCRRALEASLAVAIRASNRQHAERLLDRPTAISNPLTVLGFSRDLQQSVQTRPGKSAPQFRTRVSTVGPRLRDGRKPVGVHDHVPLGTVDLLAGIVTRMFRSPDALAVGYARLPGKSRKSARKTSKHVTDALEKPFVPPCALLDSGNPGATR